MSAWTDGKTHVIVGPEGLSVHREDSVELVLSTQQLGGRLAPKKGKAGFARLHPLAVNAGLDTAFTVDATRKLIQTSLRPKGGALKFPWDISALAPAHGAKVFAAYVTGTKARALTSIVLGVPPADPKATWEHDYESGKPSKVEWPDELLWDKAPWSRKTRWATAPDFIEIDVNAHAYTVYDTASAVVGVLRRPGASKAPEAFACVLRTPQDKGSSVAASATKAGVLVATCRGDGQAVICEFDDEGKLLRHRRVTASKIGPVSYAGDSLFAVVDDAKLVVFDHELNTHSELPLPDGLPASEVLLRPSEDGSSFLLALADAVLRGAMTGDSWSMTALELSPVPSPGKRHEAEIAEAPVEAPEEPTSADGTPLDTRQRIITQAPRLSLDPNQPNDAWAFDSTQPFEIALAAVSVGGPATETGLYVEVYGDALDKGLVEPETVTIEGENQGQASFVREGKKAVARLPEFRLPAGVEPIKDKKVKPKERFLDNPVDTFLTIRLRGQASKAGAGELLYVRVGFDGTEEGSLMRGRPVTVVSGP